VGYISVAENLGTGYIFNRFYAMLAQSHRIRLNIINNAKITAITSFTVIQVHRF